MTPLYTSRTSADEATERLKIYAQPQRLMILSRLLECEQTVSEIAAATGIAQPALSQQLAELRRAEMVKKRRASKQIYYSLAGDDVRLCIRSIEAIFGSGKDKQAALLPTAPPNSRQNKPLQTKSAGAAAFARVGPSAK